MLVVLLDFRMAAILAGLGVEVRNWNGGIKGFWSASHVLSQFGCWLQRHVQLVKIHCMVFLGALSYMWIICTFPVCLLIRHL